MEKASVKQRESKRMNFLHSLSSALLIIIIIMSAITVGAVGYLIWFDQIYQSKIYPSVYVDTVNVGGETPIEIVKSWESKNTVYKNAQFELQLGNTIATISGEQLHLGYDSQLIARQAFLIGRSGNILSDIFTKLFKEKTIIQPYFRWDEEEFSSLVQSLAATVDVPPKDARFNFEGGKVTEFQPAVPGKQVNQIRAKEDFVKLTKKIQESNQTILPIVLSVEPVLPNINTADTNSYGIKEQIGQGYSEFAGSIAGRMYNVGHAASKFNGILIAPGETFSFNKIVGEISAATGYQSAYIIKEGRTVLGDGGGVCQVSTTMFRAALNAGLPIVEWTPHAYRVQYYEQAGYKPGLDATIFEPSVDLKFRNDTGHHILIQTITDKQKQQLTINFFGTKDGRKSEILNHQILSQTPPPAPLYQDDPSLSPGVVKQVDWAAWGAKTSFIYKVTKGSEVLIEKEFVANFRPWQAVYLRGPQI